MTRFVEDKREESGHSVLRPSTLRIEVLAECRRFKEKTEKQTEAEIFVDSYSNSANFRERILALNLKHLL